MSRVASVVTASELIRALDARQLVVEFQPVVPLQALAKRRPVLEALLRWEHPTRGRLAPRSFLDAAATPEVCGRISAFVLQRAGEACMSWVEQGWNVGVAVNVWPTDLVSGRVRGAIDDVLATGLSSDRLTIEVSERACDLHDARLVGGLVSLARLGVRLSLDDFGTGESTLARLRRVHFDEVKVDRMFVTHAADDPTDRAIFGFSLQLAHALGMQAVAVGIESAACLAMAMDTGSDAGQGLVFGEPARFQDVASPFVPEYELARS